MLNIIEWLSVAGYTAKFRACGIIIIKDGVDPSRFFPNGSLLKRTWVISFNKLNSLRSGYGSSETILSQTVFLRVFSYFHFTIILTNFIYRSLTLHLSSDGVGGLIKVGSFNRLPRKVEIIENVF